MQPRTSIATKRAALSRREFVRGATAAIALPAVSARVLSADAEADPSADLAIRPLRLGLIGCGGRGTGAVVQALSADAAVTLTAMGDVFSDRIESSLRGLNEHLAERAAQRVQVDPARRFAGFDAYQRVLESGVDVVILAAPPAFRPAHLRAAVEAGAHVFCEKPAAVDAPGIRSVLESAALATSKNLALVSGFCWRYSDAERAAFKQIQDGAIGQVVTVHSTYHTSTLSRHPRQPSWSDMEFQLRNWWHFTWLSGDHLVEQACHSVDRLSWATGDRTPVRCSALGGRAARSGPEHGNVYDHFTVIYEYDDALRCVLTARQIDACPMDNTDYIFGTAGSMEINGFKPLHAARDLSGKVIWNYDGLRRDMYQMEHDELFASIRRGRPINDGAWMARSTMMSIMGRMAAYTGQTITWEQAMNSTEDLSPGEPALGPLPVAPVAIPGITKFT